MSRLSLITAILGALACAHEPVIVGDSRTAVTIGPGHLRASTAGLDADDAKIGQTLHDLTVATMKKRTRYVIIAESDGDPGTGVGAGTRSFFVDPVLAELERTPTKLRCVVEMNLWTQPRKNPFATASAVATVPDANVPGHDSIGECISAAIEDVVGDRVIPSLQKKTEGRD